MLALLRNTWHRRQERGSIVDEALGQRVPVERASDVGLTHIALDSQEVCVVFVARIDMQVVKTVAGAYGINVFHHEVVNVDSAVGIVDATGCKVGIDVGREAGIAPFVVEVQGFRM